MMMTAIETSYMYIIMVHIDCQNNVIENDLNIYTIGTVVVSIDHKCQRMNV